MSLEKRLADNSRRALRAVRSGLLNITLASVLAASAFTGVSASNHKLERYVSDESNYLIMGVDQGNRADALILINIDQNNDEINVISLPRDTKTQIAGHGEDKINHAYAFGGKELEIETVESFLGTEIDGYVVTDFDSFGKIYDVWRGFLNVSSWFSDETHSNGTDKLTKNAGREELAVLMDRYHVHTQNMRSKNHANFVKKRIVDALRLYAYVPEDTYRASARSSMQFMDTNINPDEIFDLGKRLSQKNITINSCIVPGEHNGWPEKADIYFWLPNARTGKDGYFGFLKKECRKG